LDQGAIPENMIFEYRNMVKQRASTETASGSEANMNDGLAAVMKQARNSDNGFVQKQCKGDTHRVRQSGRASMTSCIENKSGVGKLLFSPPISEIELPG
jgi:hypothetical protein